MAACGSLDAPSLELYDIPSGSWQPVALNFQGLSDVIGCGNPPGFGPTAGSCSAAPIAIGDRWIEIEVSYNGEHEPPGGTAFQNISTGQVRPAPYATPTSNSSRRDWDLNAPTLTRPLCRPIRQRLSNSLLPGTVTIEGSFVISTPFVNDGYTPDGGPIYLQRCGSTRRDPSDPQNQPLAANAHAVLWDTSPTSSLMTGLLLPSLQRFTVRAPSTDAQPILTDRRLYFSNEPTRVWITTSNFPPPVHR